MSWEIVNVLIVYEDEIYEMATINSSFYSHHKLNIYLSAIATSLVGSLAVALFVGQYLFRAWWIKGKSFIDKGFVNFYHKKVQDIGWWCLKTGAFFLVESGKLRICKWLKLFPIPYSLFPALTDNFFSKPYLVIATGRYSSSFWWVWRSWQS